MNVTSDATAMAKRAEREARLSGASDAAGAAALVVPNAGYRALPGRASPPAPQQTALKNVMKIVVAFISKDLQN